MLRGKTILVGVTGGIAAYKAVDVVSRLKKLGAEVHVIMTGSATRLVAPLTFQSISGNPVRTDILEEPKQWHVEHIALAEKADLLLVAPATANIIGKMANGIADDYLSTEFLAVTCPVLVVPAMNFNMYAHRVVQDNLERLRGLGCRVMEPAVGPMATGAVGKGRMPEPPEIVEEVVRVLAWAGGAGAVQPVAQIVPQPDPGRDLEGLTVLVTAGATREPLDPVRFLTNRSTGKMGFAVAEAARDRGARVILITGPSTVPASAGVELVRIETALEMRDAVLSRYDEADIVVKAAAVADYRPARYEEQKIKKRDGSLTLELVRNPDILAELGQKKTKQVLIGFAAETDDLLTHARGKLERKNLDLIVANDVTRPGSGFGAETNEVKIIARDGSVQALPILSKREVAERILDRAVGVLKARR